MPARHDRIVMCGSTNIGHMQLRRPIELLPHSMAETLKETIRVVAPTQHQKLPVPTIIPDRDTSPVEQMNAVLRSSFRPFTSHFGGAYIKNPQQSQEGSQDDSSTRGVVVLR
eukprot:CAMPEP_0173414218 /NCGR_PEP_ID=MMETSP1356-20130122/83896_1 /TAXON_ID=77927 ORGANISM="Hemiselmis virescens, Strain PCC157" /NCGR_SAMPLE_ID=MMETSP1356 /ASSEMBLY_ACC=CAM_ASM_000847 /LENGTH=111 /DNA_ID=CAMNT_0014376353 /DNA_START=44 /DNA_END=376 /DNA_ORIENTATION=-